MAAPELEMGAQKGAAMLEKGVAKLFAKRGTAAAAESAEAAVAESAEAAAAKSAASSEFMTGLTIGSMSAQPAQPAQPAPAITLNVNTDGAAAVRGGGGGMATAGFVVVALLVIVLFRLAYLEARSGAPFCPSATRWFMIGFAAAGASIMSYLYTL